VNSLYPDTTGKLKESAAVKEVILRMFMQYNLSGFSDLNNGITRRGQP